MTEGPPGVLVVVIKTNEITKEFSCESSVCFACVGLVCDHSGQFPVLYLEIIGPAMEQSDGLMYVIGPSNTLVVKERALLL